MPTLVRLYLQCPLHIFWSFLFLSVPWASYVYTLCCQFLFQMFPHFGQVWRFSIPRWKKWPPNLQAFVLYFFWFGDKASFHVGPWRRTLSPYVCLTDPQPGSEQRNGVLRGRQCRSHHQHRGGEPWWGSFTRNREGFRAPQTHIPFHCPIRSCFLLKMLNCFPVVSGGEYLQR